jgi:hypothetical protein
MHICFCVMKRKGGYDLSVFHDIWLWYYRTIVEVIVRYLLLGRSLPTTEPEPNNRPIAARPGCLHRPPLYDCLVLWIDRYALVPSRVLVLHCRTTNNMIGTPKNSVHLFQGDLLGFWYEEPDKCDE